MYVNVKRWRNAGDRREYVCQRGAVVQPLQLLSGFLTKISGIIYEVSEMVIAVKALNIRAKN